MLIVAERTAKGNWRTQPPRANLPRACVPWRGAFFVMSRE
jgi:hypothetical protein